MIVEQRIYTMHVGKLPDFLKTYEEEALPLLRKYLGNQLGFFINEYGAPLNTITHFWVYENHEDREKRHKALLADPAWAPYRAKNQPRMLHQENRIMKPAPFFEPILREMLNAAKAATPSSK